MHDLLVCVEASFVIRLLKSDSPDVSPLRLWNEWRKNGRLVHNKPKLLRTSASFLSSDASFLKAIIRSLTRPSFSIASIASSRALRIIVLLSQYANPITTPVSKCRKYTYKHP